MAVDQKNVSRILSVLSNPLRRQILSFVSEKKECSFTDLANALNLDTGKLSFHIRNLSGFIEQTPDGKYRLTKVGVNAMTLIRDLEAWSIEVDIAEKASTLKIADWRRRVFAFLIDFAIAFAVFIALPNVLSTVASGGGFFQYTNFIIFLILFWIYFTLLEGFAGQSLGKRMIGLRVIQIDGKSLSYDHAAVRNFGKVFLLPLDLFFGIRLDDRRFLRYFDKFSGTTVIDLRPPSRVDTDRPHEEQVLEETTANQTVPIQ